MNAVRATALFKQMLELAFNVLANPTLQLDIDKNFGTTNDTVWISIRGTEFPLICPQLYTKPKESSLFAIPRVG